MLPASAGHTDSEQLMLRWRGKQQGPFSIEEIQERVEANEIGLLHEVCFEGEWMPLRKFFETRAAREEEQRFQREEAQRQAHEQEQREARAREAQQRDAQLAEEKRKNDLLEAAVQAEQRAVSSGGKSGGSSTLQTLGWLLMIGGAVTAVYFFAYFDTSVSTGTGGRVVNLGLMNDRQSGLLVGLGMALIGVILVVFGKRSQN